MNKHKKITVLVCVFLTSLSIVACGNANEDEFAANQQESDLQTNESADSDIKDDEIVNAEKASLNQQESNEQKVENADSEMTAEEILDLFIDGSINAAYSTDPTATFYISDLKMDSDEWDSFSLGEKVDLDNDGENELIIFGPYGGNTLMRVITRYMNLLREAAPLSRSLIPIMTVLYGSCTATQ